MLRLHHVGYVVREIEPIAAEYCARLGYEVCSPVIHDPLQTALVQFLRLPGDAAYLEFVAPDGPESRLGNAAKRPGLVHLCYTAGALEGEIARMEAAGMFLFSEPKPAVAFGGRRICWLKGSDPVTIELVERRDEGDLCAPAMVTG